MGAGQGRVYLPHGNTIHLVCRREGASCMPYRSQSQPSLLSPKHRESRVGARVDLVKLMCDFPSGWRGLRIFYLRCCSGPCSDPTQIVCAAGLNTGCLVPLVLQAPPHLLLRGPKATRDFNVEVVQHVADDVPPVVASRHRHRGDCG